MISLLAKVLRKMHVFEFEILNGNTSRFAPRQILRKICVEMKEEAQAHYFENILAIPIPL